MYPTKTPIRVTINGATRATVASPYAYKHFPKRIASVVATAAGVPAIVALTGGKGRAADGRTRYYFYATPADAPESARGARSFWVELTPEEYAVLSKEGATLSVEAIPAPTPEAPTSEADPAPARRARRADPVPT